MIKSKVFFSPLFVVAACFGLYCLFSFKAWNEPIMGDEVNIAMTAEGINNPQLMRQLRQDGPVGQEIFGLWHPPGYFHVLALTWKLVPGPRELTARIPGILFFLLSLWLVYMIAFSFPGEERIKRRAAALSCLVFAVNPLAVRGSLLVDMDGSLLSFMALLLMYGLSMTNRENLSSGRFILLGLAVCGLLWSKLTTPLILIVCVHAAMLLRGAGYHARATLKIACLGVLLFCASWLAYCRVQAIDPALILAVPLTVVRGFFTGGGGAAGIWSLGRNFWTLIVWVSPMFLVLAAWAIARCLKKPVTGDSFFTEWDCAFYAAGALVLYIFVGGVTHSFPKYHYAAIPACAILIGRLLAREAAMNITGWAATLPVILLPALSLFFGGDPLLLLNYRLKEAMALGYRQHVIIATVIQITFLLFSPVWLGLYYRKQSRVFAAILAISLLTTNLGLSVLQQMADYTTVYCYGARGAREAAAAVAGHTSVGGRIIAPPEIYWMAGGGSGAYFAQAAVNDTGRFTGELAGDRYDAVVYGITGNTVAQVRDLFSRPDVRGLLEERYSGRRIGSYTVWLRK